LNDPAPIPERNTVAPPAGPGYQDQLIDPGVKGDPGATGSLTDETEEPAGQRLFALELREDWRKTGSTTTFETGIATQWRRETVNWGEILVDAALRDARRRFDDSSSTRDQGGDISLYGLRIPVGGGRLADVSAGTMRTTPRSLATSGFRVLVSGPLLFGAGALAYDERDRAYVTAGRLARLEGTATQSVELEDGRLASAGFDYAFTPSWAIGTQVNAFRLDDASPDHTSGALALAWRRDRNLGGKLGALSDDDGRGGFWAEGDWTTGRTLHRFGAYRFDRDIAFNATPILSDEETAYWRSDYRDPRLSASGSLDFTRTNLDRDPARGGTQTVAGYGTVNLRVSRVVSTGGSLSLRQEKARTPSARDRDVDSESAFVRVASDYGSSSLDLSRYNARSPGTTTERITSISLNHDWPRWGPLYLTTLLSASEEREFEGTTRRRIAGVSARASPLTGFSFDMNLLYGIVDRPAGREKDFNATLNATWQFQPDWQAQLFAIWNTNDLRTPDPFLPVDLEFRDKGVQLVLRYAKASGVPMIPLGGRTSAAAGSGRISGRVFFDENGDGLYQPTERAAARLTVLLDGRYPALTDSEGRFDFPLVAMGRHTVQVAVEGIPLPWGLIDERPFEVNVGLRTDMLVELPLSRISAN
jgi:hypothetical protein